MPAFKTITETLSHQAKILLTHHHNPLGAEIISQLSFHPQLTVEIYDSNSSIVSGAAHYSAIIYLAGFDAPSLSQTLTYTSELHLLLQTAQRDNTKFILVIANARNHLYYTAITLVTQFAKDHSLNYEILEVDKTVAVPPSAAEVIKRIVHNHPSPKQHPAVSVLNPFISASTPKLKLPHPRFPKWPTRRLVYIGLISLVIYLVQLLVFSLALNCLTTSFKKLDLSTASRCSSLAFISKTSLYFQPHITYPVSLALHALSLDPQVFFQSIDYLNTSTHAVNLTNTAATRLLSSVLSPSESPVSIPEQVKYLTDQLSITQELLGRLQTDLVPFFQSDNKLSTPIEDLVHQAASVRKTLTKMQIALEDIPKLLESDTGELNYLVLVQNENLLQATGGALDQIVSVTLVNGQVTALQSQAAESLGTDIKGSLEASPEYRRVTGDVYWQLGSSNWNPDHPTSGKHIANLVGKQLNRQFDYVVFTTRAALMTLLTEADSSITTSDLVEKTITTLGSPRLASLTPRILRLLENRQLTLASVKNTLALESINWSGGVGVPACRSQLPCHNDYLYPVITNIGSNYNDSLVTKSSDITISLQPTSVSIEYSLTMHNLSQSDYPAYVRLYFSPEYSLSELLVNDKKLGTESYFLNTEHDLSVIGTSATTPQSATHKITLRLSKAQNHLQPFHYQLDLPNQPGLNQQTQVSLVYPKTWFATSFSDPTVASPGILGYNHPSLSPFILDLDIAPTNND